jgi:hypothetical protein
MLGMNTPISQFLRRPIAAVALGAAVLGIIAMPTPAYSRVSIGIGIPLYLPGLYPPAYYPPPPVYYPPPAYYPPPGGYPPQGGYPPPQTNYTPEPGAAGPGEGGQSCNAGPYVCPMDHPVASGSTCYCLGNGGAKVWGHAD